ncbi:hypothetical protein ABVT39_025687, partial [Epinephelus coioides]
STNLHLKDAKQSNCTLHAVLNNWVYRDDSSRRCSGLFIGGVFGFEWQENMTGTSVGLCAIPVVSHISMRALCDDQLRNSVHT